MLGVTFSDIYCERLGKKKEGKGEGDGEGVVGNFFLSFSYNLMTVMVLTLRSTPSLKGGWEVDSTGCCVYVRARTTWNRHAT